MYFVHVKSLKVIVVFIFKSGLTFNYNLLLLLFLLSPFITGLPFRDVRNRFFNFGSVSVRFMKKLGFSSE